MSWPCAGCDWGLTLSKSGMLDDALTTSRLARDHYEARAGTAGAAGALRANLAGVIGNMAILRLIKGRMKEAEAEYRAGPRIYQKLIAEFPASANYRDNQATSHSNLARTAV